MILNKEDIYNYLVKVQNDFVTPINQKVDLHDYSEKVFNIANIYDIKNGKEIIAIGICYCNDYESYIAYLSLLSVSSEYQGKGIASFLIQEIVKDVKETGMKEIDLHTENLIAEYIYKKNGFVEIENVNNRKKMILKLE